MKDLVYFMGVSFDLRHLNITFLLRSESRISLVPEEHHHLLQVVEGFIGAICHGSFIDMYVL